MLSRRDNLADRENLDQRILERIVKSQDFINAIRILFYVSVRSEVETLKLISQALSQGKTCFVPYCVDKELLLFHLKSLDELELGKFSVLEPKHILRNEPQRTIDPKTVELAFVPGVAFDINGNRLGYGKGYYDRLLPKLSATCPRIGLAYECQLIKQLISEPHDVPLNGLITESKTYFFN